LVNKIIDESRRRVEEILKTRGDSSKVIFKGGKPLSPQELDELYETREWE
jgi:hypothetical protein